MDKKEFMTILYDLLADNTEHDPRGKWQSLEEYFIVCSWIDTDDEGECILFTTESNELYKLQLEKVAEYA